MNRIVIVMRFVGFVMNIMLTIAKSMKPASRTFFLPILSDSFPKYGSVVAAIMLNVV